MAILHRRGRNEDFDAQKMLAGEMAVTTDGSRKVYAAFAPGDVKELASKEDVQGIVDNFNNTVNESIDAAVVEVENEAEKQKQAIGGIADEVITEAEKQKKSIEEVGRKVLDDIPLDYQALSEKVERHDAAVFDLERFKAPAIIQNANGTRILISDSANQKIPSITVLGNTEQRTLSGNQLFDVDAETLNAVINNGVLSENTSYRAYIIPLKNGNTYVLSKVNDGKYAYIGFSNTVPTVGMTLTDTQSIGSMTKVAFTASDNYLCMMFHVDSDLSAVMLNAGTTALPWEPYCGGQPSPNPEYPQEIKPVEGKNLLDCRELTEQTVAGITFTPVYDEYGNLLYVNAVGNSIGIANYVLANLDVLKAKYTHLIGENVIVSGASGNVEINWQGLTTDGIGATSGIVGDFTERTNSSANRIRIVVSSGKTVNERIYPMIRKATISDDTYVPYGLLRFKAVNKNFLKNTATSKTVNGVAFTVNEDGTVTVNGTATANCFFDIAEVVVPNGDYILNGCPTGGTYNTYSLYLGVKGGANQYDIGDGKAITIDNSTTYTVRILINSGTACSNLIFKPMIRKADIADDTYEPYTEQTLTLSQPIVLNGIGEVKDRIVEKDGVYGVDRKFFAERITSVSIGGIYDGQTPFAMFTPTYTTIANENVLCTHLKQTNSVVSSNSNVGIAINNSNDIRFRLPSENNEDAITSFITDNEVYVVYPLATPTFEPLPEVDQIALRNLKTYKHYTYISSDTSEVLPLLDVYYVADTKIYIDNKFAELAAALIAGSEV